jgi:vacuolar-type H+-ATPase subunit I/STV1
MSKEKTYSGFAFKRINYILMIVGVVVIAIGFALMAGGGSDDPNVFNPEIFSTRRITVAPIVVMLGFIIEAVAIMYKSKSA